MYRIFFLSNSSEAIPLNIRCANVVLFIYVPHKIVFKRIMKDNVTNKQNLNLSIIINAMVLLYFFVTTFSREICQLFLSLLLSNLSSSRLCSRHTSDTVVLLW